MKVCDGVRFASTKLARHNSGLIVIHKSHDFDREVNNLGNHPYPFYL